MNGNTSHPLSKSAGFGEHADEENSVSNFNEEAKLTSPLGLVRESVKMCLRNEIHVADAHVCSFSCQTKKNSGHPAPVL